MLPIVESIASTLSKKVNMPPGVIYDDLVSWGVEGVVKALDRFDSDKGVQFKTYASWRIRGEILDNIRKEWSYRSPGTYKEYNERVQNRIAEVLYDDLNELSDQPVKKRLYDLMANSGVVYLLSLDQFGEESPVDVVEDTTSDISVSVEDQSLYELILAEVDLLGDVEKKVFYLFYKDNKNQKTISEILNLSKSKVCRIHQDVISKLKARIQRLIE